MQMKMMKRILACLLAAALMVPAGAMAVFAEEEEAAVEQAAAEESADETADSEETISVEEEEEEFDSTVEEVETYLKQIGEMDGYAVYIRPDDYKDAIEAACEKQYKDEDERKDAVKDLEKHLKHVELAMIDTEKNKLVAELEEIEHSKEETVFFSEAGHYLVFTNKDKNKLIRIRYRVSTLDSPYLFLTQDQQTLERWNADYSEVTATMQNVYESQKDALYRSEDGLDYALLGADRDEVFYCVRQIAENEKFRLYLDEETTLLGFQNKENDYIWWSSPIGANRDTRATKLLVNQLQSSAVVTYGDSATRGTTILRSRSDGETSCKLIDGGVTITYKFEKGGITVPITYKLEDDYLSASVKTSEIKETKTEQGIVTTQLNILGSFGAGGPDEEGYFVIPDGCGALIRFNNGKETSKAYTAKVYGRDMTTVPTTKPAVTEKIYMPVYGIVKDGNAMTVIADQGDGNLTLNASVAGQSLSSFNTCSFSFQLRGSDTFYMTGDYGNLTVFENGEIKQPEVSLRYYPTANKDASYMDVAETYRSFLTEEGGVTAKAEADNTEMYVDLYGGCMKSRSVLGIPITMKTSMTSFSEAKEIISGLEAQGVDDMVVVYNQWTNEGISGKVDNKAKPSGTLGGSGDFGKLTSYLDEKGFDLYPSVNNVTFKSGNGYYTFLDTTIRISNSYSRQMSYNLSYGVQDTSKKTLSLLSPGTFAEVYGKLASNYAKYGLKGASLGSLTSTIWGDYGKQDMSRDDTKEAMQQSYQTIRDAGLSLLADTCAAYAFPYADRISDVPLQSSGFDVFDEDIPFYQLVMHGVIPYSGTAINASADSDAAFLTCIATGCNPAYDMIYAEASDLKDTDFDVYYYSHYAFWTDTAAAEYKLAKEILSGVSDQVITDYVRKEDISETTFADGTTIEIDYANKTITSGGKTWSLEEAKKGE